MTLGREDCFSNQYYVNIRRLLTIIGLWPYQESSKRLPCVSLVSILMFIGVYSQIYVMLILERKVGPIVKLMQTLLPTFLFAFAYWNLLCNSTLIKKTLERIKNDWNELTCEDELEIMQRYAAQSKLYSQAITYGICCYITFLTFPSILCLVRYLFGVVQKNELILPLHNELFVTTESLYFIVLSLELIIALVTGIIGITNYSMFITFFQHACAILLIVTDKINRPFIKKEYKFCWDQTGSKREAELDWIVAVLKNYNNAINFVELITSLYGKIYIVEASMALCFLIIDFIYFFQLLDLLMSPGETLSICLYINGSLLTICAYNHVGERLMDHSISVYAKSRLVPFYALSVQTNKLFLMLTIRSMKPCSLSIRGTVVASHKLLATMMKASFSFATVFYNIR